MNSATLKLLKENLLNEESVCLCTFLNGSEAGKHMLVWPDGRHQADFNQQVDEQIVSRALDSLSKGQSSRMTHQAGESSYQIFFEVFLPLPTIAIIGAVRVGMALTTLSRVLGFRTVLLDPVSSFAKPENFPHADRLFLQAPDKFFQEKRLPQATYVVILSHNLELSVRGIKLALENDCRYVGAMGSRKTRAARLELLRQEGLTNDQLDRIRTPVGLNIGAKTPEEIAVAILAEIVAVKNRVTGA